MTAPDCVDVVELVTDYLEHRLDPSTVSDFEAHLELCDGCDAYLEQMRSTIVQLGQVPLSTLSDEAVQTLVDAFRDVRHRPAQSAQRRTRDAGHALRSATKAGTSGSPESGSDEDSLTRHRNARE